MRYVLDTNVLLYHIRDKTTRRLIDEQYSPFAEGNQALVSIVTVAEIYSLARKRQWGIEKMGRLEELISSLVIIEIRNQDIVNVYVDIETYSNKSNPDRQVSGSAIKMGKNDLWIAATAALTGSRLITSDNDFDHLDGEYFEVLKYKATG